MMKYQRFAKFIFLALLLAWLVAGCIAMYKVKETDSIIRLEGRARLRVRDSINK